MALQLRALPAFTDNQGLSFQDSHGGSHHFATPLAEDLMPSSDLHSTRHTNDIETAIQVKHSNTQNKINKAKCLNFNFINKLKFK